jgi:hypothetical protein
MKSILIAGVLAFGAFAGVAAANGPCANGSPIPGVNVCLLNENTSVYGYGYSFPCDPNGGAYSYSYSNTYDPYTIAAVGGAFGGVSLTQNKNSGNSQSSEHCNYDYGFLTEQYDSQGSSSYGDKFDSLFAGLGPLGNAQVYQDQYSYSGSDTYSYTENEFGSIYSGSGSDSNAGSSQSTGASVNGAPGGVSAHQGDSSSSYHSDYQYAGPGYSGSGSSDSSSYNKDTLVGVNTAAPVGLQAGQQSYGYSNSYTCGPGCSGSYSYSQKQTGVWINGPTGTTFIGQSSVNGNCSDQLGPAPVPGPLASCPKEIPDVPDAPALPDFPAPPL